MIFRRQFQTSLALKELWSERTVFIKFNMFRWAIFEPFVGVVREMSALWRLEMFNLTMVMSSFISLEF